jgi:hypothetical protein
MPHDGAWPVSGGAEFTEMRPDNGTSRFLAALGKTRFVIPSAARNLLFEVLACCAANATRAAVR